MAGEWRNHSLAELIDNFDSIRVPVKEADRKAGPYPYYGASGIVDYVDKYLFDGEYLLIAEDGENLRSRNTPVAFLARGKFWVNNHAHIVRAKSDGSTRFLMYALSIADIKGYLTGSTMPKLTQGNLNRIPIVVPPSAEQRSIAHILGTLDERIELNRRMNETLEAMARALFKSWFVDFDPVHAKATGKAPPGLAPEIAALFPDRLQDSEQGEIPCGWAFKSIGDLARRVAMGPFGSDIKTDNFIDSGVPVIRGRNLVDGFVDERFVYISESKADDLRNANAFPGDIVITHRGTLGQVGLIPSECRFRRYVVSQSQMLLSLNPDLSTSRYVYAFLKSPRGQHALLANTSQTGVPAIARPTTSLRAIRIPCPAMSLLRAFESILHPVTEKVVRLTDESRTLASLRDTLLPKLICGELRVHESPLKTETIA